VKNGNGSESCPQQDLLSGLLNIRVLLLQERSLVRIAKENLSPTSRHK